MKHIASFILASLLFVSTLGPSLRAAEQKLAGTIDKVDPASRTIVVDGKPLVVSPKTKFIVDGMPAKITTDCVGKQAIVVFDDSLDVALSVVLGETTTNDEAIRAFGGVWRCIAAEEVGRKMDRRSVHTQNRTLTCKKHHMTMERVTNGVLAKYEGIFVLDALTNDFDFVGKSPRGEHVEWTGIYEVADNQLKLCYRYVKDDNVARPLEFKTDSQKPNIAVFYTYKRIDPIDP